LPLNIISLVEEKWDIQEREVKTGQRPNPWKEEEEDNDNGGGEEDDDDVQAYICVSRS
jgi:hypothetical protein